jgi:alkylation response protein AidB-like acyl-CoA dehydrogenase
VPVYIALSAEERHFEQEAREYFESLATPDVLARLRQHDEGEYGARDHYRTLMRRIATDGWFGVGWPTEYGGWGRPHIYQLIMADEAAAAGIPLPSLALTTVGPTLIRHGSERQKAELLPRILAGEILFSVAYSEPDAGTDLASLRTRAVRDGGHYVINGEKMWTSLVEYADYIWLAARTGTEANRHRGLSVFLVPRDTPGVSARRVDTLAQVTNATTYDDVRVPDSALVGHENDGWQIIISQLNHERVMIGSGSQVRRLLRDLVRWCGSAETASGRSLIDDESTQARLAELYAKVEVTKLLNWKVSSSIDNSAVDASATKVFGSEFQLDACQVMLEIMSSAAGPGTHAAGSVLREALLRESRRMLLMTFGGGANEIQRDLIAGVGLGLPRPR